MPFIFVILFSDNVFDLPKAQTNSLEDQKSNYFKIYQNIIQQFILNILYYKFIEKSLRNFYSKNTFFTFGTPGKMQKKSLGPVSYLVLSFFLHNQFLFCKRCFIDCWQYLGLKILGMPLGRFPRANVIFSHFFYKSDFHCDYGK